MFGNGVWTYITSPITSGRALVAAQHAGREGPGDLHLADVAGVDLIELRVAGVRVVAGLDDPLIGVLDQLLHLVVGGSPARSREQGTQPWSKPNCPHDGSSAGRRPASWWPRIARFFGREDGLLVSNE